FPEALASLTRDVPAHRPAIATTGHVGEDRVLHVGAVVRDPLAPRTASAHGATEVTEDVPNVLAGDLRPHGIARHGVAVPLAVVVSEKRGGGQRRTANRTAPGPPRLGRLRPARELRGAPADGL